MRKLTKIKYFFCILTYAATARFTCTSLLAYNSAKNGMTLALPKWLARTIAIHAAFVQWSKRKSNVTMVDLVASVNLNTKSEN